MARKTQVQQAWYEFVFAYEGYQAGTSEGSYLVMMSYEWSTMKLAHARYKGPYAPMPTGWSRELEQGIHALADSIE